MVAAAGAVLAALYFVPTASASPEHAPAAAPAAHSAAVGVPQGDDGGLADTGAFNTRPYLIGGAVFLVVGAGLLVESTRRARQADESEPDTAP
ncbi:hypothetical protein [Streptomyces sp. NPDC021224]|uniref:hypothetical protein n=1 Tax=unclassified Streptomyces TaxID=2593676 RepID=UPI0037AC9BED